MSETTVDACDVNSVPTRPRLKVSIKKWRAVGTWTWGVKESDDCSICQLPFDACCADCKFPGDACVPVWSACNHPFHMHCILKWLPKTDREVCPLCRQEWKFKED